MNNGLKRCWRRNNLTAEMWPDLELLLDLSEFLHFLTQFERAHDRVAAWQCHVRRTGESSIRVQTRSRSTVRHTQARSHVRSSLISVKHTSENPSQTFQYSRQIRYRTIIGWHDRSWTISISNLSLLLTVTSNNFTSPCRYIRWNCSYKNFIAVAIKQHLQYSFI